MDPIDPDATHDSDGGLRCLVQYDFVPRTPPTSVSAIATGGASVDLPSPSYSLSAFSVGTSTMILTPPIEHTPYAMPARESTSSSRADLPAIAVSQRIPLSIQIRKWRVLLATVVLVGLLLLCVRLLHNGVVVAKGTPFDDHQELRRRADTLNFYFANVATFVATLFSVAASFVVPILVLVLLTETSMFNDSYWWVVGFLFVQGLFVALLTNAFRTTYVSTTDYVVVSTSMRDADLFQSPSTAVRGLGEMNGSTLSIPLRVSTDTMLRTAMLPPYVRSTKAKCFNGDNSKAYAMSFGFVTNRWLRELAANGISIKRSFNFSVNDWLSTVDDAEPVSNLPFDVTTSANLAIHAMRLLFDRVKVSLLLGSPTSPLEIYAAKARAAQAINDTKAFVRATAHMLVDSLSPMVQSGFFFAPDKAHVQFSSLQLNALIDFQAITVSLPFKPYMIQRAMAVTQFETLRENKSFDPRVDGDLVDGNGEMVYQAFPEADCGYRGCWLTKPNNSQEDDNAWSIRPEIVAYSRCRQTFTAIGASDSGFVACLEREIVNDSIAIGAIGSSLYADRFVDYAGPGYSAISQRVRRANITNLRRSMTITLGFLSWRFTDLTALSKRRPLCRSIDCQGLYYLLGDSSRGITLLDKDHIIADELHTVGGSVNAGQPLASVVTNLPRGAYLPLRNVRNVTSQVRPSASLNSSEIRWPCSRDLEFITDSIEHNHWYIDHGLQEAYTAGLFHLFQFGVNHSISTRDWKGQSIAQIDLSADTLEYLFLINIPTDAAVVSMMTGFVFLVAVSAVLLASRRRECTMREVMDVHRVARVHLVERFFPKIFLQSTVYDTPQGRSFAPFRIIMMKLHHATPEGDVFVTLPAPLADTSTEVDGLEQGPSGFAFRPVEPGRRY